ncbi:flagellar biosynthesis protein FliS [Anoxybacillus gonensis]|uniref:Flagellar secretion chaperone FliS n=1 Tax=Anoxybacillus gonensis TaxID=198467 RepID=A0AAW7TEZ5_9BACL|nr:MULTISPECIES: flagellar export chaperone FliS [Anoxybacillus]AXM89165.1 flagella export chaperone FliS [Anoxybacillus ayderensis G10]THD17781.1 flagellar protein FliS [Anoxybacillus ayderensis]AKS39490.1 flagellar biosynthesis protein FliS [Anoxybacillus gonensis]KGP60623.1 flagellar biosynthesis protein FliS [Anoxybacillus gonensis]MBW9218607.1 flagellar export chaperone FliS [Anoxybacillus sp. ST70]
MATEQAHRAYQQNSVSTASPGELTLMLYNGCLKFLNKAKEAIHENRINERNENLQKAQKIIQELMVTLNQEYEIAKQMMIMYEYMHYRLIQANIKNDVLMVEEVENLVMEFRDTWKEVIRLNRQKNFKGDQA